MQDTKKTAQSANVNPNIEKLLILQERDKALFEIESSIADIPVKKSIITDKIKEEKFALELVSKKYSDADVERSNLRLLRRSKEEKAESMNEQRQSLMKKPTEYKLLESSIENLKKEASDIEEKEIELLYKIDELKLVLEAEKELRDKNIKMFERELERLDAEKKSLEDKLNDARFQMRESEKSISQEYLDAYNSIKTQKKRRPFVVKIEDGKCGGCHLKLSTEIFEIAKKAADPTNCEMCGRLVYLE